MFEALHVLQVSFEKDQCIIGVLQDRARAARTQQMSHTAVGFDQPLQHVGDQEEQVGG